MNIIDRKIDGGKAFDWGRTSADYAKFRDIYPQQFYDKITVRGLCVNGQSVPDVGTGTDVSLYYIWRGFPWKIRSQAKVRDLF